MGMALEGTLPLERSVTVTIAPACTLVITGYIGKMSPTSVMYSSVLARFRYQRTSHAAFSFRTLVVAVLLLAAAAAVVVLVAKGDVALTSNTSKYSSVMANSPAVGAQVAATRAAVTAVGKSAE
jgi:hypothetical protein